MLKDSANDLKNVETNSGPQSDVIWEGIPLKGAKETISLAQVKDAVSHWTTI